MLSASGHRAGAASGVFKFGLGGLNEAANWTIHSFRHRRSTRASDVNLHDGSATASEPSCISLVSSKTLARRIRRFSHLGPLCSASSREATLSWSVLIRAACLSESGAADPGSKKKEQKQKTRFTSHYAVEGNCRDMAKNNSVGRSQFYHIDFLSIPDYVWRVEEWAELRITSFFFFDKQQFFYSSKHVHV